MLDILIINHPKHGQVSWYFESSVDDEPTDFLKAKALAQDLGIYEGEEREDIITEFWEFENAMREDGLIKQEDELTEDLRRLIALRARHDLLMEEANKNASERSTLSKEINSINVKHYEALRNKAKVVDGVIFNSQNGVIIGLGQA